jgi:protein-S-isoprenylcysteine O-methyltransferase Ste14
VVLEVIESWVRGVGIVVGLATLAVALWRGVWRGLQRPSGRTTGMAGKVLRAPLLIVIGFLWVGACVILWRPVPLTLSESARLIALALGAGLYFAGVGLYLWGAKTLGEMYRPSSSVGVRLSAEHKLVTHGPFAWVRHPLYVGLQAGAIGGVLLYRRWTFVFVALKFKLLVIRARREEKALAAEFGEDWEAYVSRVPAWIPRFRR